MNKYFYPTLLLLLLIGSEVALAQRYSSGGYRGGARWSDRGRYRDHDGRRDDDHHHAQRAGYWWDGSNFAYGFLTGAALSSLYYRQPVAYYPVSIPGSYDNYCTWPSYYFYPVTGYCYERCPAGTIADASNICHTVVY